MTIDSDNPVVQLCAEGMAVEGDRAAARELFARAWAIRRDDYEASIAAHFLARHQDTPEETLRWNSIAVTHAEAAADERANALLASCISISGRAIASSVIRPMRRPPPIALAPRSRISRSTGTGISSPAASTASQHTSPQRAMSATRDD